MTDRKELRAGLGEAAWSYLFLYFNINLGTVSVLPTFIGWLVLRSSIIWLQEEERELALLKPLAAGLAIWNGIDWVLSWFGQSIAVLPTFFDLIAGLTALYFHFQFITNMASIAARYQDEGGDLDARLLKWRTVQTVTLTLVSLMGYAAPWMGEGWSAALFLIGMVSLIAGLCIMVKLHELKELFAAQ